NAGKRQVPGRFRQQTALSLAKRAKGDVAARPLDRARPGRGERPPAKPSGGTVGEQAEDEIVLDLVRFQGGPVMLDECSQPQDKAPPVRIAPHFGMPGRLWASRPGAGIPGLRGSWSWPGKL